MVKNTDGPDRDACAALREKIAADAEPGLASAPTPDEILALAEASFADVPEADLPALTRRLEEPES